MTGEAIMHRVTRPAAFFLLIAAGCQTPTDADLSADLRSSRLRNAMGDIAPAGGVKFVRPSLTTTACVNALNQLDVTDTWINQTIDPAQRLTVTLVLKGAHVGSNVVETTYIGETLPSSFVEVVINGFKSPDGDVPWSAFSTIGASASGAFTDAAPALHQPKTGWPAC
jgi:hypothetical protein